MLQPLQIHATSNVAYRVLMNVTVGTMMSGGMVGEATVIRTVQGIRHRNVEDHGVYRCIELVRVKLTSYCPCEGGGWLTSPFSL